MIGRLSLASLLIALTFWVWWRHTAVVTPVTDDETAATAELASMCEGDSMLAKRLTSRLYPAIKIGRTHGHAGLETLDLFGDDAVYLFEEKPESFAVLTEVSQLEGILFSTSAGRWRDAVIQWATAGTLPTYLKQLKLLTEEDRTILGDVPEALPLLISDTPIANRMLLKYAHRAWELLRCVDLQSSASIERVAAALEHHGEQMLDLNDRFGATISWLLVSSERDVDGVLPTLFLAAIAELGDECAGALFLTNYEDLQQLIFDEHCDPDSIRSAIVFIASQEPPELRNWVADSPYSIRLLLETHSGRPLGQQVFSKCGLNAATLLYQPGGYGVQPVGADADFVARLKVERLATLLVLRDEGEPAQELLWSYQNIQSLRQLLRRGELSSAFDDPLISRVIRKLTQVTDVQGQLDVILLKPADQLLSEEYPETTGEKLGGWIPGYTALKTSGAWMKGYHVTKLDATIAIVDGVSTAFGVSAIVSQAIKTTGNKAVQKTLAQTGRELVKDIAQDATESVGEKAMRRLPGSVLASLRTLATSGIKLDVTQLARSVTATAKKIGIRSWGPLDRRIIMRGDRKVIVDFLRKEVRDEAGNQIGQEIGISAALDYAPLLFERTVQGLGISE